MSATNGTASSAATLERPEETAPEVETIPFDPNAVALKTVPGISFYLAGKLADRGMETIGELLEVAGGVAEVDQMEEVKIASGHVEAFLRGLDDGTIEGEGALEQSTEAAPEQPEPEPGEHDGGICHDAGAALADAGASAEVPGGGFVAPLSPGLTPDDERQCLSRHHHECLAALKRVRAAETEVESAKNVLKEAKEELEEWQIALNLLVGRDPFAPTQAVLFKETKKPAEAVEVCEECHGKGGPNGPASKCWKCLKYGAKEAAEATKDADAAPEDFTWRDERLDGKFFGPKLGDTMVTLLFNADIQTLGGLSDFQKKHGEFWIKELKGVGKKKGDKIADVCEEFWPFHKERLANAAAGKAVVA